MSGVNSSNRYSFGSIQPVPPLNDFLDIVLSRTQRKTPTVVHKGYAIGRIRDFYLRKIKFTQATFDDKLGAILDEFPRLDDVHPFYSDLMNILYDKDHYKLALGQVNTARHLIDTVGKEYCKLLKFGDSLYRCKQLKRAGLGRMATIMKRQKETLLYLEQVRQHLSRLPCIDPNTRTLLVCGFPNVGKSSFMNKVTRANVDVQPYAFTTKSLFVGHMDYKYLRWQVLDTPGILDHPLEERNTIEMQSITALAHLRACILFFIDVSGNCGYSIEQQVALFKSIAPLFVNKPILVVLNKIDLIRPDEVDDSDKAILQKLMDDGIQFAQSSCVTDEGVMDVRNLACEKLLAMRVDAKMRGQKINDVLNRLHLTTPQMRDQKPRPPCIPEGALANRRQRAELEAAAGEGLDATMASAALLGPGAFAPNGRTGRKLARHVEEENGGPGVYNVNLKEDYILKRAEWKMDDIPELFNGKNIADFIDPDIEAKLARLEAEEEEMEASHAYDETVAPLTEEEKEMRAIAVKIREKRLIFKATSRLHSSQNSNPVVVSRIKRTNKRSSEASGMDVDHDAEEEPARRGKVSRGATNEGAKNRDQSVSRLSARSLSAIPKRDRSTIGLSPANMGEMFKVVTKMKRDSQIKRNMESRKGEADRVVYCMKPKHLFSGKRSNGTNNYR